MEKSHEYLISSHMLTRGNSLHWQGEGLTIPHRGGVKKGDRLCSEMLHMASEVIRKGDAHMWIGSYCKPTFPHKQSMLSLSLNEIKTHDYEAATIISGLLILRA